MKIAVTAICIFLLHSSTIYCQQKPKIVISIVVDQMRWEYLNQFSRNYSITGFEKLIKHGFSCPNTHVNYFPTFDAPGYASLYTGTVASIHGIPSDMWYDKNSNQKVYCVDDSTVSPVGIKMNDQSIWNKMIPWYITIACTISLILISIYLFNNLEWFKTSAVNNPELMTDGKYRIFIYSTHLSILKRSLGIVTGIAITFIGLGVSFYALEKSADMEISGFGKLSTFSPGIIAILLGCYLISQSISSKDSMTFAPTTQQQEQLENH